MTLCDNFVNSPPNAYRPLACKPRIVTTRELRSHGYANKLEFFFLNKANNTRENATLDLLYPTPLWYKTNLNNQVTVLYPRVTQDGDNRVIDTGLLRVARF